MEKIEIAGKTYTGVLVPTQHSCVLMIQGGKGFLGCGYFQIETANKLNEAVAIVRGVKNFQDMLEARVTQVSEKAKELGLTEGMTGKEALNLLS